MSYEYVENTQTQRFVVPLPSIHHHGLPRTKTALIHASHPPLTYWYTFNQFFNSS